MAIPQLYLPQWGQQVGQNILAGQMQRREEEQRNALAQALPGALAGDQQGLNRLLQVSPELGVQVYGQQQTRQQALGKEKEQAFQGALTNIAKGVLSLPPERRPAAWTASATRLAQLYPEQVAAQQITPEWDDTVEPELAGLAGVKAFEPEKAPTPTELQRNLADPAARAYLEAQAARGRERAPTPAQRFSRTLEDGTVQDFLFDPVARTETPFGKPYKGAGAGGTPKAPTEGERTAGFLLRRLEGAQQELQRLESKNKSAAAPGVAEVALSRVPLVGEGLANLTASPERQQVKAAQLDFLDAALTLGTGAAYTRDQLESYRTSYFPAITDDPATVEAKRARLAQLVEAGRIKAGAAAPTAPQGAAGPDSNVIDFNELD